MSFIYLRFSRLVTNTIQKPGKLFLLISFLYTVNLSAQLEILEGYIISREGDTIRGYIDYNHWTSTPAEISFRKLMNRPGTQYSPADIKGFAVKGEIYKSAVVDIAAIPGSATPGLSELKTVRDTVFLQAVILGPRSLWMYSDRSHKESFYIDPDGKIQWLVYQEYSQGINGQFILTENSKFRGQLTAYLEDWPDIQSKVKGIKYNSKVLYKLFLDYYAFKGSGSTFSSRFYRTFYDPGNQKDRIGIQFGPIAGISHTRFLPGGVFNDYIQSTDFTSSTNMTGGLFADFSFAKTHNRLSVYNELYYSSYYVTGYYSLYLNSQNFSNYSSEIGISTVRLSHMLRYQYPVGKFFVFGNLGISYPVYRISENNFVRIEKAYNSPVKITEGQVYDTGKLSDKAVNLGLGVKYGKLSAEFRYDTINGPYNTNTVKSSAPRVNFMVGYAISLIR
jgi:hypothetical protein